MEISYLGHSCFKIVGKNISVLTDPFDSKETGYKMVKTNADVVTISHGHFDHNDTSSISGEPMLFDGPGEYEIKDSSFEGIPSIHGGGDENKEVGNTIFVFDIDGLKLCHLGDQGEELTSEQLEKINGADIVFVPVGGNFTLDAEKATKVISQIEPKVVIPMHYGTKDGKIKLESVDKFLHEIGASDVTPIPRLKIVKKDLPEETKVVTLEY